MTTVAELFAKRKLLETSATERARDRAWTGIVAPVTWTREANLLVWDQVTCTSCGTTHPAQAGFAFLVERNNHGAERRAAVSALDPTLPTSHQLNPLHLPFCNRCTPIGVKP